MIQYNNKYAVIMAGGIGSRFWPMSTIEKPKQYHDVLGTGKTLIQQTLDRLSKVVPISNIYVITNLEYKEITQNQLSELNENQIICEPAMMNTAACVIYVSKKIHELNPDASLIIAPSDHVILNENEFVAVANKALNFTENQDILITLGIKPSRPDTGYGYIQYINEKNNQIKKVKNFTEKPNLEKAKSFIDSGDFLWNAGIFIWNTKSILNAFETYMPEMFQTFDSIKSYNNKNEQEDIKKIYTKVTKISIDYAVMEKANNVFVIPSDFGWSDLGTWKSLFENSNKTQENNAILGSNIKIYNTKNSIIKNNNQNKVIILDGLENFIVVDTKKALLICPIDKEQNVKDYVNDLKLDTGETFL